MDARPTVRDAIDMWNHITNNTEAIDKLNRAKALLRHAKAELASRRRIQIKSQIRREVDKI